VPDNHGVVFVRTDDSDFTGGGVGVIGDIDPAATTPFSELSIIDVASKTVTVLAKAMGYNTPADAANNLTYLAVRRGDLHHTSIRLCHRRCRRILLGVLRLGTTLRRLGLQRQLWARPSTYRPMERTTGP